jgi:hypothetical protein
MVAVSWNSQLIVDETRGKPTSVFSPELVDGTDHFDYQWVFHQTFNNETRTNNLRATRILT